MSYLDQLSFDDQGLITAVVVDHQTAEVLMVARMNAEALRQTVETGVATYWSRSRGKLWVKGEHSGHKQLVRSVRTDCDKDVVLLRVTQQGPGACHRGFRSCFSWQLSDEREWQLVEEQTFDPQAVYGTSTQ